METALGVWLPQVTIVRCRRLEEAQLAVEAVRSRHCVVLQLEDADPAEAQRIVDFLCGASSALDGSMDRIGDATFLIAPMGVNVRQG